MANMKPGNSSTGFAIIIMNSNKNEQDKKAREAEKQQVSILRSGNSVAILDTIDEIRSTGKTTILPEIFELLLDTEDDEVMEACTGLLNDLKTEEGASYVVAALKNPRYRPVRQILVSSCWQSGLDYHDHAQLFAKIVLKDDYATAIEAFTVIENSLGDLDDDEIVKLTSVLKEGVTTVSDNKKGLIRELLSVIRNF